MKADGAIPLDVYANIYENDPCPIHGTPRVLAGAAMTLERCKLMAKLATRRLLYRVRLGGYKRGKRPKGA